MRSYELLMVVRPDLDDAAAQATVEKFTSLITSNGGEIEKIDAWGKRRLAYEIKDYKDGVYTIVYFKGEPSVAAELDRVLKITDEVIRFLIVRSGE
jgi:small subunit ribosomal protein S6